MVVASADETVPGLRDGHAMHIFGVIFESVFQLARSDIPSADTIVAPSRPERLAVG